MDIAQAEALFCLAAYSHHVAGHGEKNSTREWKQSALHRLMKLENAQIKAQAFESREAMAP